MLDYYVNCKVVCCDLKIWLFFCYFFVIFFIGVDWGGKFVDEIIVVFYVVVKRLYFVVCRRYLVSVFCY